MSEAELEQLRTKVRMRRAAQAFSPHWARTTRRELGLSQTDLGAALGVDPSVVSRGERGATTPAPDVIVRWVDLLRELRTAVDGPEAA